MIIQFQKNYSGDALMKKSMIYCVFALLFVGIVFLACSNENETESEQGSIDQITGKAAKEMVNKIRTPINKARAIKDQEEKRLNEMDESVKEEEL
jgi:hypothetical protein